MPNNLVVPRMPGNQLVPPPRQEPGMPGQGGAQPPNPVQGAAPDQLAEMLHQTSFVATAIREMFQEKANPDAKDVISAMGRAVAEDVFDPKAAAQYLSTLPTDPMKIKPWLIQHMQNAQAASQHIAQVLAAHGAQAAQGAQRAQDGQGAPPAAMAAPNG